MRLEDGDAVEVTKTLSGMCLRWENDFEFFRVYLLPAEALELAAELVKLAMPEATKEEETNAITA